MKLSTPSLTPAQLLGLIPVLATLLTAFGVYDLSQEQTEALEKATIAVIGLFGADALIRHSRAKHLGARIPADAPLDDPDDEGVTDEVLTDEDTGVKNAGKVLDA